MYRFAPSLSQDMHIGNLRVALYNYICAKQNGEQFIVRMEDTDRKNNKEGKAEDILDILAIFGITYDNLYYQSENFKYHLQFVSTLLDQKKAFACFCTKEELAKKEKLAKEDKKVYRYDGTCTNKSPEEVLDNPNPFTIRIKKPEKAIKFKDIIKEELCFEPDDIDSFVIMEKEKYPTYNFACACDDMIQGIQTIIREEEHLSNTPKQELIRNSLGYHESIEYAHLPVMLDEMGKKISTAGDRNNVRWLLDQGFMPEAISNYLLLLGNETPYEIFTTEEAFSWLDLTKLSKEPSKFDMEKLRFLNREHIKTINNIELSKRIGYSCTKIGQLAKLYTQEVSTTLEIKEKIDAIFSKKEDPELQEPLDTLRALAKEAPHFENFRDFKAYMAKESGLKGKEFFRSLRFLLTGAHSGPNLSEIYPLIKNYLQEIIKW